MACIGLGLHNWKSLLGRVHHPSHLQESLVPQLTISSFLESSLILSFFLFHFDIYMVHVYIMFNKWLLEELGPCPSLVWTRNLAKIMLPLKRWFLCYIHEAFEICFCSHQTKEQHSICYATLFFFFFFFGLGNNCSTLGFLKTLYSPTILCIQLWEQSSTIHGSQLLLMWLGNLCCKSDPSLSFLVFLG